MIQDPGLHTADTIPADPSTCALDPSSSGEIDLIPQGISVEAVIEYAEQAELWYQTYFDGYAAQGDADGEDEDEEGSIDLIVELDRRDGFRERWATRAEAIRVQVEQALSE